MFPIYIYFHICCINNWKDVVSKIYDKIKSSFLYDILTEIRCGVLYSSELKDIMEFDFFKDPKVRIAFHSNDLKLYETPTLNMLRKDCIEMKDESYILYLHSKGVTRVGNKYVENWINYMIHFLVERHMECFNLLFQNEESNAVGVELKPYPHLHYSGNFWWAKSTYLKNLNECVYETYYSTEFWIGSGETPFFLCLWITNYELYSKLVKETEYINKPSKITFFKI